MFFETEIEVILPSNMHGTEGPNYCKKARKKTSYKDVKGRSINDTIYI